MRAFDAAVLNRRQQLAFIVGSVHAAEQPPVSVEPRSVVSPPRIRTTAEPTSSLPPEYVCQRESHCIYGINTGNGYWGKWQFAPGTWTSGANQWNAAHPDRLIPTSVNDWASVEPWMEDAVAAEIYKSGAGCGHWNACN